MSSILNKYIPSNKMLLLLSGVILILILIVFWQFQGKKSKEQQDWRKSIETSTVEKHSMSSHSSTTSTSSTTLTVQNSTENQSLQQSQDQELTQTELGETQETVFSSDPVTHYATVQSDQGNYSVPSNEVSNIEGALVQKDSVENEPQAQASEAQINANLDNTTASSSDSIQNETNNNDKQDN